MSNRTFSAYFDFQVNIGLMYINCSVCKLNYVDHDYAKEWANGDPGYFIEHEKGYIHFCGAICASEYLYPAK